MKGILIGICRDKNKKRDVKRSLRELGGLLEAIGGKVIGYIVQKRSRPDPGYFIGEGKAKELKQVIEGTGADAVIFDDPLTPSQVRNLEKITGVKVLDRTDLVLEIFSRRARSREAKLQVELARLSHELPRIYGRGKSLSRLGGGVGTRGPGEQVAEVKRRVIKNRIHQIKRELEEVRRMKKIQRKRRNTPEKGEAIIKVAIVGYTNAGKSTLLKTLTSRETKIADMLFASLETTTSVRRINGSVKILFTDTVGFINKLPPELIESFKTTLEEVIEADIILHVVDISDERWLDHISSVRDILHQLGTETKPIIYVLNKADKIVESCDEVDSLPHPAFIESPAVVISANKRWNISPLIDKIVEVAEKYGTVDISKTA